MRHVNGQEKAHLRSARVGLAMNKSNNTDGPAVNVGLDVNRWRVCYLVAGIQDTK